MMGPDLKHVSHHSAVSSDSKLPALKDTSRKDRGTDGIKICFVRTELNIVPMPFINGAEKLASAKCIVVNLWQVRQGWAKISGRA